MTTAYLLFRIHLLTCLNVSAERMHRGRFACSCQGRHEHHEQRQQVGDKAFHGRNYTAAIMALPVGAANCHGPCRTAVLIFLVFNARWDAEES